MCVREREKESVRERDFFESESTTAAPPARERWWGVLGIERARTRETHVYREHDRCTTCAREVVVRPWRVREGDIYRGRARQLHHLCERFRKIAR